MVEDSGFGVRVSGQRSQQGPATRSRGHERSRLGFRTEGFVMVVWCLGFGVEGFGTAHPARVGHQVACTPLFVQPASGCAVQGIWVGC
jgi:hypothetical protein